jgi:kynurenine 3-monooxygenase
MTDKAVCVAVVGAGLVGSLEACYLAQRGMEVHVYDVREDIRQMEHVPGRSINLAMSVRALSALSKVGLAEHVKTEYGIPMHARMIHNLDGRTYPIPYGKEGQCIYSVGRRYVNEILLDKGDTYSNITYHFNHKLVKADLDTPQLTFVKTDSADGEQVVVNPDLVIGCDGAYSAVRREMMRKPRFNYSQEYIPHAYMELSVPPTQQGDFAMARNYLHIWPRGQFMMIALPNQDKSFTLTLFMPTDTFNSLTDRESVLTFFMENFQDSIPLIGRENLVNCYLHNPALPLVSVKCSPYNVGSTALIMGDAAHAMVPFYGQGMNCGMEDCLVLDDCLDRKVGVGSALEEYSRFRNPDAEAMCDLAVYNYIEMRDLVNKKSFLLRKKFDNFLHWMFPNWWVPLYTSVTFSRMRYHQCIENKNWQDSALTRLFSVGGVASLLVVFLASRHQATSQAVRQFGLTLLKQIPRLQAIRL